MPERIVERAHFQACVVSRAVVTMHEDPEVCSTEIGSAHGCDRRSLRRWVDRVAAVAEPSTLATTLLALTGEPVVPPIPNDIVRRRGRVGASLRRAVTILALLEAIASVEGFEPPALGHVARIVAPIPAVAQRPSAQGDPASAG